MNLKELVEWFLDNCETDWDYISVSLVTAVNMAKIAGGDTGDFIIFNNGSARQFTVWAGEAVRISLEADCFIPFQGVYAYRLAGEDCVIQVPLRVERGRIYWGASQSPTG